MRISEWRSDVSNSDIAEAADQQADSRNRAQQGRQYLRGSGKGFTDLFGVENVEIVLFASGDVPTLSQQLFNRVLHGRCVVIVIHRDHDGIDVLIALETALDGLDRHDDDVILVAAKAALPAGGENANDFAAYIDRKSTRLNY